MKFKQLSTGTVLTTNNEAVIDMMTSSDAYAVVEEVPKVEPAEKAVVEEAPKVKPEKKAVVKSAPAAE